jgi:hypothetical protein
MERFELLRTLFAKERVDYVGVRVTPDAPMTVKAYCHGSGDPAGAGIP